MGKADTRAREVCDSTSGGADCSISENPLVPEKSWKSSSLMVTVGGLALFSDGYNAQVVGYMNPVLTALYPEEYTPSMKIRMSNSFLIGEIFGMLFFGWAIDKLGRRNGVVFATAFLVLGIVLTTAAHGATNSGMIWMMIIGRGIAGFGAGGMVWSSASTHQNLVTDKCRRRVSDMCDHDNRSDQRQCARSRQARASVCWTTCGAVDAGFVAAGIVAMIVLSAYQQDISDGVWRVSFGIGIVLPFVLLFFRLKMVDSTQYSRHAMKDEIPYLLILKRYWRPMIGTTMAWFMYDFVVYPFGIYSSTIISGLNPDGKLIQTIGFGTAINAFFLPGCFIGGLLMDMIGRRQTMTLGFVLWAVMGFVIGGAVFQIKNILPLFIVLYGIFNSLGEMGPGVATFLCCAESFPTPIRGHFLGLAAAVGKAGAAIGTEVFIPIQDSFSTDDGALQGVFLIGSAFAMTGALISWFLIPDRDRDLSNEDEEFSKYLRDHGYTGRFGVRPGSDAVDVAAS